MKRRVPLPSFPIAALLLSAILLSGCGEIDLTPQPKLPTGDSPLCTLPTQPLSLLGGVAPGQAPDWNAPHMPGQVLITGGNLLSAQSLGVLSGVQVQQAGPGVLAAQTPQGETDRAFAGRLTRAGLNTQPNFVYRSLAATNDPGFPGNGGVTLQGARYDQYYLNRIRATEAWATLDAVGQSKEGVRLAVLDTGVDQAHPDLQGRLLPGCTFTSEGGVAEGAPEVSEESEQIRGHGTSTAGLAGAVTNNGVGISSLTWGGQNIVPVKVIGETGASTLSLTNGLRHALGRGAKVINLSLGMAGDPGDQLLSAAVAAASQSAVLVAAAGNTSDEGIYYPASLPQVIAVGALAKDDRLACYSARQREEGGRSLDIVAPGGNAGTSAQVTKSGKGCMIKGPHDLLTLATTDQGGYTLRAGTSEAAPLVSGVASLMWGANPALSAAEVKARLLASTRQVGDLRILDAAAAVGAAQR